MRHLPLMLVTVAFFFKGKRFPMPETVILHDTLECVIYLTHVETSLIAARNLYKEAQYMKLGVDYDISEQICMDLQEAGVALNRVKRKVLDAMNLRALPVVVDRV
jgi:hypothetical protein